jgi:hypothetical protein
VASAQVLVIDIGTPVGAGQTDANGQYRIDGLALNRIFTIRVKDNASARFGFSPQFVISNNGDEVTEDVTLLALGFVNGSFSDATGTQPIPGATVTLTSNSLLGSFRFFSGTDGQGKFTYGGIPQGTFSLFAQEPLTGLSGTGSGSIDTEGQTVVLDLRAQANGTVQGTVLDSNGATLAIAPAVTLTAPGITAQTVFSSSFSFAHVPVGVPFTVTAEEQISPPRHRAVATGTISANGEVQTLELRYVPYGAVNVHVVRVAPDGTQTPADRGTVISSRSTLKATRASRASVEVRSELSTVTQSTTPTTPRTALSPLKEARSISSSRYSTRRRSRAASSSQRRPLIRLPAAS